MIEQTYKAGGCSLSSNSLGELPGVPAQPGHLVAGVPGLVLAIGGVTSSVLLVYPSPSYRPDSWPCPTGSPPHSPWSGCWCSS